MLNWTKAPQCLTDFNGLRCSVKVGSREFGVFKERHSTQGCTWSLRSRPLDASGEATDSWNYGQGFESMTAAKAWAKQLRVCARCNKPFSPVANDRKFCIDCVKQDRADVALIRMAYASPPCC